MPVLIHCSGGKDRTGFVVAILLAALGVVYDDIVADYLASRGRCKDWFSEATRQMILLKTSEVPSDDVLQAMLGVEESYLRASFTAIDENYGGLGNYLAAAGIKTFDIDALRNRLLPLPELRPASRAASS